MLNAWRRHWNRHPSVRTPSTTARVLNAWRRHWNRHRADRRSCDSTDRCAQRLAASLESARESRECRGSVASCAQRLAASLESAPETRCGRIGDDMCSTPGGVIGIGTDDRLRRPEPSHVLNAWRRHWNRHIANPSRPWRSASVLNAWRRHWNRHFAQMPRRRPIAMCSTPGGVIGIGTDIACRSQRLGRQCSTPGGVIGIGTHRERAASIGRTMCSTPGGVIGIGTASASTVLGLSDRCSTPGGVIGIGTRSLHRLGSDSAIVLNAWRRHWNRHDYDSVHRGSEHSCAQRLAASLESALDQVASIDQFHGQCSTPGGVIGIGTADFARSRSAVRDGAQRLAASLESAPDSIRLLTLRQSCAQRLAASLESAPRARGSVTSD